jgi:two-component system nitrogen regulation sensor histidine kinase NtrY
MEQMWMRDSFAVGFWLRIGLLSLATAMLAILLPQPAYRVTSILAAMAFLAIALNFLRYVRRTNMEVAHFLNAVRFADLSQGFAKGAAGTGFDALEQSLNASLDTLRSNRDTAARNAHFYRALIDHVPIALLAIHNSGRVDLLNSAARRLIGPGQSTTLKDLEIYGTSFVRDLAEAPPGKRRLTSFLAEGMRQSMTLSVAQVSGAEGAQRIVSLQNIQQELNAAELVTWRDLVRVLTHEIMNSITPVASLAKTAADLMTDANPTASRLADARAAIETVARRSEGLERFVQSYRELTKLPAPDRRQISVADIFDRLERLFRTEWPTLRLHVSVTPRSLELHADAAMIEQALINILRNASQAVAQAGGEIWLAARLNRSGRVTLDVTDNGPGVAPELRDNVFLPFFTTKPDGTGVGLSLARQIVLAHGGAIALSDREAGGARFTLMF